MSPVDEKQGENREVGPGKPPAEHRFKKGKSGNPKGRPRGKTLLTRIQELLDEGDREKAAKAFIAQMKRGSFKHINEIIIREEGKVPDRIAGADGGNVVIEIVRVPRRADVSDRTN